MTPSTGRVSRRKKDANATVVSCSLQPYRGGEKYKLVFSDGSHKWLERTTNILQNLSKDGLFRWHGMQTADYYEECYRAGVHPKYWDAVNAGERARDAAAARGTQVHKAIEDYLLHGVVWDPKDFTPGQAYQLKSWLVWWEKSGLVASQVEFVIYSQIGEYAGTVDLIVKDGDGWRIYDWKTGSLQPTHAWQLAAYAFAIYEMGLGEVVHAELIDLPKDIGVGLKANVLWDRDRLEVRQQLMGGWNPFLCACRAIPTLGPSIEFEPVELDYIPDYVPEYAGQPEYTESEIEELFASL